jgi:phosphoribosylamine-glycine ligase
MAFKVGNDGKFYFLEFTPRAGINAVFGLVDLLDEDLGEFLVALEAGRAKEMDLRKEFNFTLTISVYPYPYEIPSVYLPGVEVQVPDMPKGAHWWPFGVEQHEGRYTTAEGYPLAGYISVCDKDAARAINRAMVLAEEIQVTGKQYRNDGLTLMEPLKLLRSKGIRNV